MIISTFALKLRDVGRRGVKARGSTKTSNNVHWRTETCLHLHIPLSPPPQHGPDVLLASSPPTDVLSDASICFSHQVAAPSTPTQHTKPRLVRLPQPLHSHARWEAEGSHLTSSSWLDNSLQKPLQQMFPVLRIIHITSSCFFPLLLSLRQAAEHPTAVRDLTGYHFGSYR